MVNPNSKHRSAHDELLRDVLFSIVTVRGIESSIGQDRPVERIFNDRFLLVIIEPGIQDVPGMVIYDRRKIGLNHLSVPADRKLWAILDIRLKEHHPVRFAEPFRRALLSFDVLAHLFLTESGFIQMTLESRPFQDSGFNPPLAFQNEDDLPDAPRRDFPFQLDRLRYQFRKVFRKGRIKLQGSFCRLKPVEAPFFECDFIPAESSLGNIMFLRNLPAALDLSGIIQIRFQERRDHLVPLQRDVFLPCDECRSGFHNVFPPYEEKIRQSRPDIQTNQVHGPEPGKRSETYRRPGIEVPQ